MSPAPDDEAERPDWHALGVDAVVERLDADLESGLSDQEAAVRLDDHGPNELVRDEGPGPWWILWEQFTEPLVVVLIAATVVSLAAWWFGESEEPLPYDAIVILAIVVLNAVLGFVQEYRAERALEALEEMAAPEAKVRRDGRERRVPARELVPGDVVLVESGDRIAADLRLARVSNLKVDESALTGESVPISKGTEAVEEADAEPGDRVDMVFMGTAATFGHGEGVVVATGSDTEMGEIAELLTGAGEDQTPLQRDLARVGRQLGLLVLGISVVVAAAGVLREGSLGGDVVLEMFLFGVALAVAAVPEGLPAIVTAVLAIGVRRLAGRDAIVRRLPAVEALGSATVIASDKTGTLTRNEMTVRRILLGIGRIVEVEGEGFDLEGAFRDEEGGEIDPEEEPDLERVLALGALVNDARLVEEEDGWTIDGDPTEGALVVAARKAGLDEEALREERPRLAEIPFSSERKRMTTLHEGDDDGRTAAVKGAPELVLERCERIREDGEVRDLTDQDRESILERAETFAGRALRTLAIASRSLAGEVGAGQEPDSDEVEKDLVWEGLIGMIDPPRPGVEESVTRAREAGVRTILVTGDHVLTGRAVAETIGIAEEGDEVLAGHELAELADEALEEKVSSIDVYGRVRPEHKLRIVRALKARDQVVAMTGDGVNDAPALKEADIGVAMGIAGTDVAREASEIVLADDDYSTIVDAIEEGRKIFDNIRKFVRYLLTANAGEVLTIFGAVIAAGALGLSGGEEGFFLPLLAVQILWVNLVTDGPPALALGMDPGDPRAMERPPRDPTEPIIDRPMWVLIGVLGTVIMLGSLFVLDGYLPGGLVDFDGGEGGGVEKARTMAFTTLVLFEMFDVFNCLSATETVFRRQTLRNRWLLGAVALSVALQAAVVYWGPLQSGFDTVALTGRDWAIATAVASSVIVAAEILKRTPLVRKE